MQTKSVEIQRIAQALKQAEKNNNIEVQIRLYEKLLRVTPGLPAAHAQLAHLHFELAQEAKAEPHVDSALKQAHDPEVDKVIFPHLYKRAGYLSNATQAKEWYSKGKTLTRFKLLYLSLVDHGDSSDEEVESLLHDALNQFTLPQEQSQLLTLLGQLYSRLARFHDSIACYHLGLQMTPENTTQLLNMAVSLENVGRYAESLEYYKRLLEIDPDHPAANNNIALNLLRLGEFKAGWPRYEWRWAAALKEHYQQFSIPRWTGQPLQGKTLLVWAEQGIGDHVMFASMLNELHKTADELHYEIYARLDSLFRRSFPGISFIRREIQEEHRISGDKIFQQAWPKSDYHIPIGSLPEIFRPTPESFQHGTPYLIADPEATHSLREDYRKRFPGKRLVGISWRGGKTFNTEKQSRNISFEYFASLASYPGIQLIDLQYDSSPEDFANAENCGVAIYHDERVNPTADMDIQASQICALDAVVSIDNTTVHLAGALGMPTYALLPLNPNWRWGMNEGQSLWYKSVQLFRNRELLNWQETLDRVVNKMITDGIISHHSAEQNQ